MYIKTPAKQITHLSLLASALLAAAGVGARLVGLSKGFTFDELYSMGSSSPSFSFSFIWQEILLKDVNAPLYNILLYFWNHLFPAQAEWTLRLPSLFFGLLTLATAWKFFPKTLSTLCRKIYFFLLCCNAYMIYYAQEARTYALLLFLAQSLLFAALCFAQRFKDHQPVAAWEWTLYFFAGLVSCYLHYFGAAFFFSLTAVLAVYAQHYQHGVKILLAGMGVVFIAFCPWLWLAEQNGLEQAANNWWIPYKWSQWARSMGGLFFNHTWLSYAALGLCVVAVKLQIKTEGKKALLAPHTLLPAASVMIILLFVWAVSGKINLLLPRYFMVLLPSVFFLFSDLFSRLIQRDAWLISLLPALLLGLMYPSFFDNILSAKRGLNPMQASARFLAKEHEEPELAYYLSDIDYPAPALDKILRYYPQKVGISVPLVPLSQSLLDQRFLLRQATRVWVPLCGPKRLTALEKDFDVYTVEPDYRHCLITLMPTSRFSLKKPLQPSPKIKKKSADATGLIDE